MDNKILLGLAAGVGSLILAGTATADFQGLSVDAVDLGGVGTTYRLYADIDAGGRVDAVYGNSTNALSISATGGASFYQNLGFGGNTSVEINSGFFAFVPSIEWDSYVTIGALYQDGTPFGNNALQNIGIDFSGFNAGGALGTDNGTWFVTPDDAQGGEIDGRVLLGQFTVLGGTGNGLIDLDVSLNLQGRDGGDVWSAEGLSLPPIPAPGALALLGIAGLAVRRRRK